MTAYADTIARAPKTLTELEQRLVLKTSGEHRRGFRDHVIFRHACVEDGRPPAWSSLAVRFGSC